MQIGWHEAIGVGPLLVVKTTDVTWLVVTPDGDGVAVREDAGAGCGYLGESWAVDAVLSAEQTFDLSECPTRELTPSEVEDGLAELAAACLEVELFGEPLSPI